MTKYPDAVNVHNLYLEEEKKAVEYNKREIAKGYIWVGKARIALGSPLSVKHFIPKEIYSCRPIEDFMPMTKEGHASAMFFIAAIILFLTNTSASLKVLHLDWVNEAAPVTVAVIALVFIIITVGTRGTLFSKPDLAAGGIREKAYRKNLEKIMYSKSAGVLFINENEALPVSRKAFRKLSFGDLYVEDLSV